MNLIIDIQKADWVDILEQWSTIATSATVVIAYASWYYTKRRDRLLSAIDQITFFREKIIEKGEVFMKKVKTKRPGYILKRVELGDQNFINLREKHFADLDEQVNLTIDCDTQDIQTEIINLLEEFSLKVIHSKTSNHKILNSVKPAFIQIVELNCGYIFMSREIMTGNKVYDSILKLYKTWDVGIDKRDEKARLAEFMSKLKPTV